jgi:hypothetical protein
MVYFVVIVEASRSENPNLRAAPLKPNSGA